MDYMTMSSGGTGSDTLSGSVGCSGGVGSSGSGTMVRSSRVRTIRLVRPYISGSLPPPGLTCRHGPGLGFSIRGGREHGTGFFVSHVEPGSEAHRQGLKVGDQIIRVNGFMVEDAVHKEVLQLISNHTHLTLKVRSVGMIPVKDKCTDPLSWQIIPDYVIPMMSESPPLEEKHHDVRISIAVAQKAKLGCGICKGPEWKPGIFVQFTKEAGIARDAGLRPGDQILYCNNIDFTDISFNEAINVMKISKQLDLIVRKGAGSELFPSESSGYNSSASSVTGDQSPSWSECKRLSIVKEESLELEDRLNYLDFQRYKPKSWDCWDENPRHFKPTIINLSENGTTIKNNGNIEEECHIVDDNFDKETIGSKLADICLVSHQHETKTVFVEVHRSEDEANGKLLLEENLSKSPSIMSFKSSASRNSTASSSLSSAISMELQRRAERNKEVQKKVNIEEELQKNKILKCVNTEKKHQHDKLMDEFRKAHRKMFSSSCLDTKCSNNENHLDDDHVVGKDKDVHLQDRQANYERLLDRRCTIGIPEELNKINNNNNNNNTSAFTIKQTRNNSNGTSKQPPPPPPPMPSLESKPPPPPSAPILHKQAPPPPPLPASKLKIAPPIPVKHISSQPPPCPTPDYDTLSLNSTVSSNCTLPRSNTKMNGYALKESVDMDSLESYQLTNPNVMRPKPPNTYFNKPTSQQNGTVKKPRPVSVTIGEYPTTINRRAPIKFNFLHSTSSDSSSDVANSESNEPITSRLASELAQTLSRSNLRKRTEANDNLLNGITNGTVTISVNKDNKEQHNHKLITKSKSIDTGGGCGRNETLSSLGNRVMIKISDTDLKTDVPNSILKNGNGNNCSTQHKPLVHQKSITFGEITTVINDQPMHVS